MAAGAIAAMTMVVYGTSRNSAITKAAAPMIGGVIWPPALAAASTPPARCPGYPILFMFGMVSDPVDTVLAMDDPDMVPKNADETTLTLASPPV